MPYTATNNLNDLVETSPPATGTVASDLGPAALETRRTFKAVILKEHNADGSHASVNGNVLVAGSVPSAALAAGAVVAAAIANETITGAQIAPTTIDNTKIVAATLTTAQVATKTLLAANMASTAAGHVWVGNGSGGMGEVAVTGAISINSAGVTTFNAALVQQAIAIFADIETSGTDGGTFTSGAWQVRKLNSTIIDSGHLFTLSANVLTLATAGTYYIRAESVAYKVDKHQIRLYDNTNTVVLADGMPATSTNASTDQSPSTLETVLTLAAGITQTMELQHQCQTTEAADGLGKNTGFGDNNIFSRITIIKLA